MIFEVPFLLSSVSSSSNYLQFRYFFSLDFPTRNLRVPDYIRDMEVVLNVLKLWIFVVLLLILLVYFVTCEQKLSVH